MDLMRRVAAIILAGGLVAASVTSAAGASRASRSQSRTVSDTYVAPAVLPAGRGGGVSVCVPKKAVGGLVNSGCIDFDVKAKERFVEIKIEDASGLPAPAWIQQQASGLRRPVCGSTEKPIPVAPGKMTVWLQPYRIAPMCPGISTTGTVRMTFLHRR